MSKGFWKYLFIVIGDYLYQTLFSYSVWQENMVAIFRCAIT